MSKFCPFCGEELVDDAKFCKNCGKDVSGYKAPQSGAQNTHTYYPPVKENSHTVAVVLGFICAVLIPLFGFIFGIYLVTRKDSANAKTYGIVIIALSVIVWIISFLIGMMMY